MSDRNGRQHQPQHRHAFAHLNAVECDGLVVARRRSLIKASLASLAGLSLPGLLRHRVSATLADRLIGGRPLSSYGLKVNRGADRRLGFARDGIEEPPVVRRAVSCVPVRPPAKAAPF